METILSNEGNRRYFRQQAKKGGSFTVNVWRPRTLCGYNPRLKRFYTVNRGASYDAGFYVGEYKTKGKNSGPLMSAKFKSPQYRDNIMYRIRVWPKKGTNV